MSNVSVVLGDDYKSTGAHISFVKGHGGVLCSAVRSVFVSIESCLGVGGRLEDDVAWQGDLLLGIHDGDVL